MDQQIDQPLIHATLRATYPPDASEAGTQLIQLAIRKWHHVTIVTFQQFISTNGGFLKC